MRQDVLLLIAAKMCVAGKLNRKPGGERRIFDQADRSDRTPRGSAEIHRTVYPIKAILGVRTGQQKLDDLVRTVVRHFNRTSSP